MTNSKISFVPAAFPDADCLQQLADGLRNYNRHYVADDQSEKVGAFAKSDNKVIAGAYGVLEWGWLYVDWLWCDSTFRGCGIGKKLLISLEEYAKARGFYRFKLTTADFQALGFYQKLGYEVYAELEDFPPDHKMYYLKKVVDQKEVLL